MLGRAGIIYKDEAGKYFIDSETLIRPPYDIVIFADSVKYYKSDKILPSETKMIIAKKIKDELEAMSMLVELK